jgi:hypothetical protein
MAGRSFQSMTKGLGIVLGAGLLGAAYQIAYEEGRTWITGIKSNGNQRRMLNQSVMMAILVTDLPIPAKDVIRRSRNAWDTAMALAMDVNTPEKDRKVLEQALGSLIQRDQD